MWARVVEKAGGGLASIRTTGAGAAPARRTRVAAAAVRGRFRVTGLCYLRALLSCADRLLLLLLRLLQQRHRQLHQSARARKGWPLPWTGAVIYHGSHSWQCVWCKGSWQMMGEEPVSVEKP